MNKKFWATAFTLAGAVIGAGILGLPYVFSKAGFLAGLFWIVFLGLILIFVGLSLGEVSLRTKQTHQLPGYAGKYLGKTGKKIMFFATVFGIYSALLAYLIGEGQSFSQLLAGNLKYSLYFGIAFWFAMTLLLRKGLRGLKKVETWGVLAIILIVLGILIWLFPNVQFGNLNQINFSEFFVPFGVVLFALLGFTAIPEMKREIAGQEKDLKKAIILGSSIPIVIYILFSLVFVGVLGNNIAEIATLSFSGLSGKILMLLGIFTMLTSYFVLSFALKDMFRFDLRSSKKSSFFWVSLFPILLYLFVSFFSIAGFIKVLGIGGVVSGGLTGILILMMNHKAKSKGNRKPEFSVPINWIIIIALSLVFVFGVVVEVFG